MIRDKIKLLVVWFLILGLPIIGHAEKPGWPKEAGNVFTTPTVADIDGDKQVEIIVGVEDGDQNKDNGLNGCVYVWHYDGTPVNSWPQITLGGGIYNSNACVGDFDPSYPGREIAVGSGNKKIYVWHADGTSVNGWPKELGGQIRSTLAMKDLNGDGKLDLIVGCIDGRVYAFTQKGENLSGWPQKTDFAINNLVVEDINNDNKPEVLSVSGGKIYVWNNEGKLLPGWPKEGGYTALSVGDIDPKYPFDYPALEIVAAGKKGLNVLHLDGSVYKGWPQAIEGLSYPVIGDINNDGLLEIVAVLNRGEKLTSLLYAYKPDGTSLSGWPVEVKAASGYPILTNPVLKDLNGDGYLETVIGHTCYTIHAYDYQGQMVAGFPIDGIGMQENSPAIYDVDGDGRYELIFGDVSRYLKVHMLGLEYSYKKKTSYQFSPQDEYRGYITYSLKDPYGNNLYDYKPSLYEVTGEVSLFASSKEYEPASFSIYTNKDLKDIEICPDDLKSADGEKIAQENIDIRIVKCWEQQDTTTGKMRMVPELLLKDDRIKLKGPFTSIPTTLAAYTDIPKDTSKQFWVTVYVPEGTKAALYTGNIYFKPKNGVPTIITLKAKVLPINLPKSSKMHCLVGGNPSFGLGWYGENEVSPDEWEEICRKKLIDMREHGIQGIFANSPLTGSIKEGRLSLDFTNLAKLLKLQKEVGLTGPISYDFGYSKIDGRNALDIRSYEISPEADKLYYYTVEQAVGMTEKYLKENWKDAPNVYYCGVDEPSTSRGGYNEMGRDKIEVCKNMFDAIHRGGGLTTTCLFPCTFGGIEVLGPLCDLPDYHYDYLFPGTDPKVIKKEAESKKGGVWWWWGTFTENPKENRLMAGFILWKSEGTGTGPFCYMTWDKDPYDDTDGHKDMAMVYPSKEGPVPTLSWEAFREGVDDTRYLTVLTELARKKMGEKSAEEKVAKLLDRIGLNMRAELVSLSYEDLQKIRWQIIQEIIELSK